MSDDGNPNRADPNADDSYFGYAIGKSVGNAVIRNRVRRRLRAAITQSGVSIAPGLYLFGVKGPRVASIEFADLVEDVERLFLAVSEKSLR